VSSLGTSKQEIVTLYESNGIKITQT